MPIMLQDIVTIFLDHHYGLGSYELVLALMSSLIP